jgi:di/tricarboxylate transporter
MLRFKLGDFSGITGQTIEEARLLSRYNTMVIGIERNNLLIPALSNTKLKSGDSLLVAGTEVALSFLHTNEKLEKISIGDYQVKRIKKELGLAEVMITPKSSLIGNSIIDLNFRQHHNLTVLGVKRMGKLLEEKFSNLALEFGDTLLVAGAWKDIALLQEVSDDFLILDLPKELEEVSPNKEKAPYALGILAGMLLLMTFNLVPSVTAVLLAALAMVITGALSMNDAYRSLNAQSLVLIAGMLPMAIALDKTGGVLFIANALVDGLGEYGPFALMAGLFVLTSIFSQFISNTATTVLVAPIAVAAASVLDVSVYPILMTVAIAASTAFATPVASPVNTLVLGPGGYRFIDYVKMGVPLQIIVMIITLLAVPILFPL